HVADSAQVGGSFTYQASGESAISPNAQIEGKVVQQQPEVRPTPAAPTASALLVSGLLDQVRRFITLLLVGVLLLWVAPTWTRHLGNIVQEKPLPSFVYGIIGFLLFIFFVFAILGATIILAIIFGVVQLGNLLPAILSAGFLADAALVIGYFIFTAYVPQVALSFWGGRWVLARIMPAWVENRLWPLCIGLLLFVILTAIPVLGGIIGIVVVLLGLGALWLWVQTARQTAPGAPVPAPDAPVPAPGAPVPAA
ncbi:MAG: hypothetical protein HY326_12945, partial [Chloroflexi bacterium]|nr:hypothetical protein [Chloroflexota bacterium]